MTILYQTDWLKYPTAIIDTKTTNTSFLNLSSLYKDMGIKNSDFLLALYTPELQGVDPRSPDLTADQKFMIRREVTYNPWYYFREIAHLPPNSGNVPRRFQANRGNIALYWSFFNHIDFALLQPRQTGKSVSTDVLMVGLLDIWSANTDIFLITKDLGLRAKNIARLKDIRALLPDYIYFPNKDEADNTEGLTNKASKNTYSGRVGRNEHKAADKLGRGLTVPVLHFDEFAFIELIGVSTPIALASGSAARLEAAENGQAYGNVFTTTAGRIDSRDGGYAHGFMTGGAPWTEHFFDLPDIETLRVVIRKSSTGKKPLIYGPFNHRQLGKTDQWLLDQLAENAMSGEVADREFMNVWTSGTGGSPFTEAERSAFKASEKDVQYMQTTPEGYTLRWFIKEHEIESRMASGAYVLGLDPSEALGGDNDPMGFVLLDAYTHDIVCSGRFNELNTNMFAAFLGALLVRYKRITFIPERKSTGISIIETLLIYLPVHGEDPFKRIYNRIVDDRDNLKTEYEELSKPMSARMSGWTEKYKRHFGYVTSATGRNSRDSLYIDSLRSMTKHGATKIRDKLLIGELLGLATRNDRIDHQPGCHDDMVISLLLAHWFCIKARNLSHYGIDTKRIFGTSESEREQMSPEAHYAHMKLERDKFQFHQLLEQLNTATDQMAITRLELNLRMLSSRMDTSDITPVGIDAMIQQATEERRKRMKLGKFNKPTVQSRAHFGQLLRR